MGYFLADAFKTFKWFQLFLNFTQILFGAFLSAVFQTHLVSEFLVFSLDTTSSYLSAVENRLAQLSSQIYSGKIMQ